MIPALSCVDLGHTYGQGELAVPVLKRVDLALAPCECAVLCGPSGSGKTTLLSIAGCLHEIEGGNFREMDSQSSHRSGTRTPGP